MHSLTVDNLHKKYGDREVLKGALAHGQLAPLAAHLGAQPPAVGIAFRRLDRGQEAVIDVHRLE